MTRPEEPVNLESDEEEYEEEYEVEDVLNLRLNRGKREYLIKWKGYPLNESTWEPMGNLEHCHDKIREFHHKNHLICDRCDYLPINSRLLRKHCKKLHCQEC
jgi:hypothetical protein